MRNFRIIFSLLCGIVSFTSLYSQPITGSGYLSEVLAEKGFENVSVVQNQGEVYIFFENRVYRWEIEAIREVLDEAVNAVCDSSIIHLVPMHYRIPLTRITTQADAYKKYLNSPKGSEGLFRIDFNTDSVRKLIRKVKPVNRSHGKIDIVIAPGFKVQFGNYDHPVEWQFSISPVLQTSLWKGMSFSAQILLPLHSELKQAGENKARLGTVAFNQLLRLPQNTFLNVSGGVFSYPNRISSENTYQRYGFHADLRKYSSCSNFCAGGYFGYTGQFLYNNGVLDYWPLDRATYGIYCEYREPVYNLTTKLTAGKFLYDDYALRFDLSRQFGEVSIGFFVMDSEFGYNGGFNFIIPISARKLFRPSRLRINPARYFSWEYSATTVYPSAALYYTGYDLDSKMRFFNKAYLKKTL